MREPPRSLKNLEPAALAEALVDLARRARRQFDNGGTVELAETLAEVRAAADEASGPSLFVLEVAEAFLRTVARSDLGKTELALRRFALGEGEPRTIMLQRLAEGRAVSLEEAGELRQELEDLADIGALRKRADGTFDLRPSLRSTALDLVEPEPFRVWRLVQRARSSAALGRLTSETAEQCIAAELGVTVKEAHDHLMRNGLTGTAGTTESRDVGVWAHYKRPPRLLRDRGLDDASARAIEAMVSRDTQTRVSLEAVESRVMTARQGTVSTGAPHTWEASSWSKQSEAS